MRTWKTLVGVWLLSIIVLAGCANDADRAYRETFDAPGNWRTGTDTDAEGVIDEGVFDFLVKADNLVTWTTAGESFTDGIYELEATQVEGSLNNGYGMLLRTNDEQDNFYLFEISGDGYVWIGRYRRGGEEEAEPLVGDWWFESDAVNQGLDNTNRLRVRVEGGNFIFFVNDIEVGRFSDDAFASGDIGLLVRTLGEGGVRVEFDNFNVTPLDSVPVPPSN